MQKCLPVIVVALGASLAAPVQGVPNDPQNPVVQKIAALNQRMHHAVSGLKSMECTFHRTEYKRKQLDPTEAWLKVRTNGDVFMRITKGANEGRDILYRPNANGGKLLVSNPVFNVSLALDNFLVTRASRYTLREAGIHRVAKLILDAQDALQKLPPDAATHEWIGPRTVFGQKATCYRSTLDKKKYPQLFAYKSEVCVGDEAGLPLETKVWDEDVPGDGTIRLVGHYKYEKCTFNHLTDRDFDEENPAYRF